MHIRPVFHALPVEIQLAEKVEPPDEPLRYVALPSRVHQKSYLLAAFFQIMKKVDIHTSYEIVVGSCMSLHYIALRTRLRSTLLHPSFQAARRPEMI